MLGKLLKNDLRKNMKLLLILFGATILVAGITRGCKALGENLAIFKILGIVFDSFFYALVINSILHPFLRSFLNFSKSIYGDESYLTHTLPVTKNQIINSKYLTAIIEIVLSFICVVGALLIMFASPETFETLKAVVAGIMVGEFSTFLFIMLVVILIIVEFLMFISIIFFSIIIAYRSKERRVLKSFLITALMAFISSTILSVIMVIVFLINGVDISSSTLVLSKSVVLSVVLAGIIVYSFIATGFYFLAKREFNKGVNVD